MHLLLLGLILVIGILVYYIMTTSAGSGASSDKKKHRKGVKKSESQSGSVPDDLRKEDNVIFLPRKDGDDSQSDL